MARHDDPIEVFLTDSELVCRACGNPSEAPCSEAWNTLSRRYLPLVWRYAYALLQNTHDAEDVVSEVMLAFLTNLGQIDPEAPKLSAWLRSVVRHKIADHHRRLYRAKDHLPRAAEAREQGNAVRLDHYKSSDPATPLLVEEKRTQINEILAGLPERQRLALEWKYIEGIRVREIASRLGETEKAVEATLYRARREFRRLFELSEQEATGREVAVMFNPSGIDAPPEHPWQTTNIDLPKK